MPTISNAKYTNNVSCFFSRGINPSIVPQFGALVCNNYGMIKQIARDNVKNGRPLFNLIAK